MKTLKLILALVFISAHGFAQQIPMDSVAHRFVYEGIVKVDSISKAEIFSRAKEWIVRNLKSSDSNVNLDDKESKSLTSAGNIHLENRLGHYYSNINLNFKLSVFVKDEKYKYIVESFTINYIKGAHGLFSVSGPLEELEFNKSNKEKTYTEINTKILSLLKDLEAFNNSKENDKKKDW